MAPHPDGPDGGGGPGGAAPDTVDIHRLLVAAVRDYAIFMLDPGGHIRTWNLGAQRLKGYAPDEIIGRHFSTFYPEEVAARGHPAWELEQAAAEGSYEEEGWRIRKGGSRFWASVTITALRDATGELLGFAKVTRDLTDRKAAEERAIEDARRLAESEAANRAKSEFLTMMSHEFRTPLNAIGGYVDLLAEGVHGAINDAQREALGRVKRSQRHLLTLINDLLSYARIEAGGLRYEVEPVRIGEVVEAVLAMVGPQAAGKRLEVAVAEPATPVIALADASRVEQILLNLLGNAVKFTQAGGRLTVSYRAGDDAAEVVVDDTGVGIPEEALESVFEPFTQVGRSYTSSHEGAGLGLPISRELARAMGGDLTAVSTVGEGSTFTLTLPLAEEGAGG